MTPHAARFSACGRPEGAGVSYTACPVVLCLCSPHRSGVRFSMRQKPRAVKPCPRCLCRQQAGELPVPRHPRHRKALTLSAVAQVGLQSGQQGRPPCSVCSYGIFTCGHGPLPRGHNCIICTYMAQTCAEYMHPLRRVTVSGQAGHGEPSCAAGKRLNLSSYILSEAMP